MSLIFIVVVATVDDDDDVVVVVCLERPIRTYVRNISFEIICITSINY